MPSSTRRWIVGLGPIRDSVVEGSKETTGQQNEPAAVIHNLGPERKFTACCHGGEAGFLFEASSANSEGADDWFTGDTRDFFSLLKEHSVTGRWPYYCLSSSYFVRWKQTRKFCECRLRLAAANGTIVGAAAALGSRDGTPASTSRVAAIVFFC